MPLAKPQAQSERHEPKYNQTQIDQLAAYIASLAPGPAKPDAATLEDGAKIAEGGELFRTNCASCHQAVGQGGALSYGKHAPALGDATPVQIAEAMRTGPGEHAGLRRRPAERPAGRLDHQVRAVRHRPQGPGRRVTRSLRPGS